MKQLATPLLLAALLGSAATVSAQTTFRLGVRGGANRAFTTLAAADYMSGGPAYSADKSAIYSWQAGLVLEASFHKFAFQPALLLSQKGEKFATSAFEDGTSVRITSTNRYNWLELPLNVVYTLHGDHGLQLFAGPYLALAVGGRQKGVSLASSPVAFFAPHQIDSRIAYGSDTNNNRLDAGFNFGIGYRQGPVQVQLGYGLGLRNLHRTGSQDVNLGYFYPFSHKFNADAAYNRGAQLTGTYFFSL